MNLPNKITMSRIFIVPVFMVFILPLPDFFIETNLLAWMRPQLMAFNYFISIYGSYIAAAIFIIASSTDGIDGYIARKRQQVTRFGIFLDPVADKLLVTSALIALVQRGDLTGWAALIIISRELIVMGLRLVASGEGVVIAASKWGKIKTVLQIIAITAALLKNFPLDLFTTFDFSSFAMALAIFATLYSMYDYLVKNIKFIKSE
ncbi:MAG: CDP-diacylglycerol--glycerol-3-phosphate 3-phosphatidyltransferase [Clostridiales bacterium]|nr:CDP-diacylglycerol--glycerol-3-phosphate 3-phosphatidyltransferase [Clostridiales bacterium]